MIRPLLLSNHNTRRAPSSNYSTRLRNTSETTMNDVFITTNDGINTIETGNTLFYELNLYLKLLSWIL